MARVELNERATSSGFWLLILALILGVWAATEIVKAGRGDPTPSPVPSVSCVEDEPCWDCDTMGNQVCGPTVTPSPKVRRS